MDALLPEPNISSGLHEALDTSGKIKDTLYLSESCPAVIGDGLYMNET